MAGAKTTVPALKVFLVIDSGPMIALAVAGLLPIALVYFGKLIVPETVMQECISNPSEPGARAIRDVLESAAITVIPDVDIASLDPAYAQGFQADASNMARSRLFFER